MNTEQIVNLLVIERGRLNAAIQALQGPAIRHRGRPPAAAPIQLPVAAVPVAAVAVSPTGRKMSAAGRKRISAAAKARWAALRAAEAAPVGKAKGKTHAAGA
jgi:hypothetical protein